MKKPVQLVLPWELSDLLEHALRDYTRTVAARIEEKPEDYFSPNDQLGQLQWLCRYISHKNRDGL